MRIGTDKKLVKCFDTTIFLMALSNNSYLFANMILLQVIIKITRLYFLFYLADICSGIIRCDIFC